MALIRHDPKQEAQLTIEHSAHAAELNVSIEEGSTYTDKSKLLEGLALYTDATKDAIMTLYRSGNRRQIRDALERMPCDHDIRQEWKQSDHVIALRYFVKHEVRSSSIIFFWSPRSF